MSNRTLKENKMPQYAIVRLCCSHVPVPCLVLEYGSSYQCLPLFPNEVSSAYVHSDNIKYCSQKEAFAWELYTEERSEFNFGHAFLAMVDQGEKVCPVEGNKNSFQSGSYWYWNATRQSVMVCTELFGDNNVALIEPKHYRLQWCIYVPGIPLHTGMSFGEANIVMNTGKWTKNTRRKSAVHIKNIGTKLAAYYDEYDTPVGLSADEIDATWNEVRIPLGSG